MPVNSNYNQYKQLKNALVGLEYKGYPLDRVLGSYLATFTWRTGLSKLKYLIRLFFKKNYIRLPENTLPNTKLYTYSIKRDDYLELIDAYISKQKHANTRVIEIEECWSSIVDCYSFLVKTPIAFSLARKTKTNSILEKIILFLFTLFLLKTVDFLEKEDCIIDEYFAFNSSYLYESFLSFYFRNRSIKNNSLQHGMYFKYNNQIPMDIINYENVCAENLLCWGDYSREQINSYLYSDVKPMVFGYPKKIDDVTEKKEINLFYVFLPREIYLKESLELISFLANTGNEYLIRPHPSIRELVTPVIKKYDNFKLDDSSSLVGNLQNFNYLACIGFNSTAIFEAILYGQKIMQYLSENDEFIMPDAIQLNKRSILEVSLEQLAVKQQSDYFFYVT